MKAPYVKADETEQDPEYHETRGTLWETPVPIPNTTVKTQAADGTALETVWESRWPPDQKKNNR